jgi:hypothetical protein
MKVLTHGVNEVSFPGAALVRFVVRKPLPLETETALFVLASALDVFMTYILLRYQGDHGGTTRFYESNPIAHSFFLQWGVPGLVGFKFAMVAFVALITQLIAHSQVASARRVLNFGTIVLVGVVLYSLALYMRNSGLV